jgi:hypothetical protein
MIMPIEICEEFVERLAKREEELAERAAEFPFASSFARRKWGDAPASPLKCPYGWPESSPAKL